MRSKLISATMLSLIGLTACGSATTKATPPTTTPDPNPTSAYNLNWESTVGIPDAHRFGLDIINISNDLSDPASLSADIRQYNDDLLTAHNSPAPSNPVYNQYWQKLLSDQDSFSVATVDYLGSNESDSSASAMMSAVNVVTGDIGDSPFPQGGN